MSFDTNPIYLINLLWKLGLGISRLLLLIGWRRYGSASLHVWCLVFLLTAEEAKHVASTTWPEMYANRRNVRAFREIGVEKHDDDVRFKSGSENMTVSCMRNASGHNYRNSSVIVNLAMGQIPCTLHRTYFIF